MNRPRVTYAGGTLAVSAENSSLNQILSEISHQTGMKITGGVSEERVFGSYGPDSPSKVLAALLDGTGTNILLVQSPGSSATAAPVELVLTPRHGGPTPPNPNATNYSDRSAAEEMMSPPRRGYLPAPLIPVQNDQNGQSNTAPVPPAIPSGSETPTDGTQQSPNGTRTPQQIYEQLMRLRQQPQQQ